MIKTKKIKGSTDKLSTSIGERHVSFRRTRDDDERSWRMTSLSWHQLGRWLVKGWLLNWMITEGEPLDGGYHSRGHYWRATIKDSWTASRDEYWRATTEGRRRLNRKNTEGSNCWRGRPMKGITTEGNEYWRERQLQGTSFKRGQVPTTEGAGEIEEQLLKGRLPTETNNEGGGVYRGRRTTEGDDACKGRLLKGNGCQRVRQKRTTGSDDYQWEGILMGKLLKRMMTDGNDYWRGRLGRQLRRGQLLVGETIKKEWLTEEDYWRGRIPVRRPLYGRV